MESLHGNAEKIWKLLTQYSKPVAAKEFMKFGYKKSVVYNALRELESKGLVIHEKGKWTVKEKPSPIVQNTTIIQEPKLGFWASLTGYFERRAERKERERQEEEKRRDYEIKYWEARCAADRIEMNMNEDEYKLTDTNKIWQKVRKEYGLD